jgi:hypothetical protein
MVHAALSRRFYTTAFASSLLPAADFAHKTLV